MLKNNTQKYKAPNTYMYGITPEYNETSGFTRVSTNSRKYKHKSKHYNNTYNSYNPFATKTISNTSNTNVTSSNLLHFCNNCGKIGHYFYQCKNPITSYGVIVFRIYNNQRQYLMICRRNTLGYLDFLRGKYSLFNAKYIKSLIKQMTNTEINKIKSYSFDELWYDLWKDNDNNDVSPPTPAITEEEKKEIPSMEELLNYSSLQFEKLTPKEKFTILKNAGNSTTQQMIDLNRKTRFYNGNTTTATTATTATTTTSGKLKPFLSIYDLIEECKNEFNNNWEDPEWGFSKGRRNYRESDYECAIREMKEETGYSSKNMKYIKNINPFEETFFGSNYKCYKHKYYLMYMDYNVSLNTGQYEKSEVSCIKWCSYDECVSLIRSYNIEKIKMITNIEECLNKYILCNEDKI